MNLRFITRFVRVVSVTLIASSALCGTLCNGDLTPEGGLTVATEASTGSYTISSKQPVWSFSGTVGSALSNVTATTGSDAVGNYSEESFEWTDGHPYVGTIRDYANKQVIIFSVKTVDPMSGPTPDFPSFTTFPSGLSHMSFRDQPFSPHTFSLVKTSTPWIFFDTSGDTAVLSPGSDFIVSQMHGDGTAAIGSGLLQTVTSLPAGFAHSSVLTIGIGIESTVHNWGNVLTAITGKTEPIDSSDPMLKYFGYWTDNGATYYYNYDLDKGYTGTLLAVKSEYDKDKIPLHYMQLDSWWYQKSRMSPDGKVGGPKNAKLPEGTWNAYGGTLDYSASPELFPAGLASFNQQLGMPFAVHGRWIDPASLYHTQFDISGIAPIDSKYWDDRARYMAENGVFCYEQDWFSSIYPFSPEMAKDINVGNEFTDNMASATASNHETMQYCMATPRFFLQGSKYQNLTTIRSSDDRFERARWNNFVYTSSLANAMHIRPWVDTFMSNELGNIVIATLSDGPVGVGDKIGTESVPNIDKVIRADGVIIRPDAPLVPTDASIINDATGAHQPLIASTYTNNGVITGYVFAFTRTGDATSFTFTPKSIGLDGTVYIEDLNGNITEADSSAPFTGMIVEPGWSFLTIASTGKSGVALFGDDSKFVGTGRARIDSISDVPGRLAAVVNFAPPTEKTVTLTGCSAFEPKVTVMGGKAKAVSYDPKTNQFTVEIEVGAHRPIAADGTTKVTVIFTDSNKAVNPSKVSQGSVMLTTPAS